SSTWYCAGGTATEDGFGDHVLLVQNPSDRRRTVTITALPGEIAPAPAVTDAGASTTSTTRSTTTTSTATTARPAIPEPAVVAVGPKSRIAFFLRDIVEAPLAGAIVEVEGGEVAVEHEIRGSLGRATAPCATTASPTWSVPWGVTTRGARELLVFMNPFPDDATVDIAFATDDGVRDTARFTGFVVPGRSVVGAYVDEDVTRKEQVSAKITVRGGRVVVDRIQTFSGVDGREGMTIGLGAPASALTWLFPDGLVGEGLQEQIVVYNPGERVAEVEVEVRHDDPETNGTPEPFELTVAPTRYAIVNLHQEDRITSGVGHSTIVRSLNGVPVVAERAVAATEEAERSGVAVTLGAPLAAPQWFLPGGGVSDDRDEFVTILNASIDEPVTYSVIALANGQELAIQGLQDLELAPGARVAIRLADHVEREDLPLVVIASRAIVVERGLYRVGGDGISQSMGIPLASDVVVPSPVEG
ncbi:MAG TPA: DUF5719 family protein, partial [Acidimicrobiales bacterium]|nr:DUF5719 family protein [Acidimicrobiales bacterium]